MNAFGGSNKTTFSIIAFLLPIVGVIVGIVLLTKSDKDERKLGEHTLALSILFAILWSVLIYFFLLRTTITVVSPVDNSNLASNEISDTPKTQNLTFGESANIDNFEITVKKVVDNVDVGYKPSSANNKYVQVQLSLTNHTNNTISENANLLFTATRSDSQSATIAFTATNQCTNFNYGTYTIAPNKSASGCVYFEIPTTTTLASISYSQDGIFSDYAAITWK